MTGLGKHGFQSEAMDAAGRISLVLVTLLRYMSREQANAALKDLRREKDPYVQQLANVLESHIK